MIPQMRLGLKTLLLVAALLGPSVSLAKPIVLGVEAMRQLAFEAAQAGYAEQALEYTDLLLQRDAKDSTALIIRSQALRSMGRTAEARKAARQAWGWSQSGKGRYGAAMAMAQALSTEGRRTMAQLWLRRAALHAPNDNAYAVARRDFGYVKSRNPWVLSFDASVAPSSNVNNGSSKSYITVPGYPFPLFLSGDARALSGMEFSFGATATYRFSPTGPNRQTEAKIGLMGQQIALSADAKAAAPEAKGSDFSYQALELGLTHNRGLGDGEINLLRLSTTIGHNWYGGNDLSNYLRLSADLNHPFANRSSLNFGLSADHTTRLDRHSQSSDRLAASVGYGAKLGQDRLTVEFEFAQTTSASTQVRNEAATLSMGWQKAKPVAGVGLAGGLQLSKQLYGDWRNELGQDAGARQDLKISANVQMTFEKIDYMGFSPVMTVRAEQNQSNSARYERQNLGISLGIQSSF